jgi:lipoprotein-anchoring transpeptidase ErfK/SrfK
MKSKHLFNSGLLRTPLGYCFSLIISLSWVSASAIAAEPAVRATPGSGTLAKTVPDRAGNVDVPKLEEPSSYLPAESTVRLVVRLSQRKVYVYQGEQILASYPIAVGKAGWETPKGEFKVFLMEKNPVFKSFKSGRIIPPGPDNPLGVRWIGVWTDGKTQLGFHGTNQPELVGQAVSHGCMRMLNKDVVSLYEKVTVGTPVTIYP